MIIWRGKGILIALTAFGCIWSAEYLTRQWSGNERYYQTHSWPAFVAFLVAAAAVYSMRGWLGVGQRRILVDQATQQRIALSEEASLFFVPARYWPSVLAVMGVVSGATASLGLVQ
jgi:hypothetical protein